MTLSSTDYALLAQNSYEKPVLNKRIELGGVEYRAIETADNRATGFQATAYQRRDSGEIIIAYRGTEFGREPVHDGGVDAGMVLAGVNAQTADSVAFTQRVLKRAELENAGKANPPPVTVTGHSLGGTLAEINAAKFGLKGETFNAYGAAGLLQGVPAGGHQVIDNVRAGDLVSAASAHFGEVRVYAAQQDIDKLAAAGYRDNGGLLTPRNPIAATDFNAHAMENFVPDNKLLGASIMSPESLARYRAHEPMIDRYRSDVHGLRTAVSASWEVPRAIAKESYAAGVATADAVKQGAHAVSTQVQHVAHDLSEVADHVRHGVTAGAQRASEELARSAHALGNAAERLGAAAVADARATAHAVGNTAAQGWNTLTHPGSWFENSKPTAKLDEAGHPDHELFKQARNAVHRLDTAQGRASDQSSHNISGALVVSARRDGLQRIDGVALSDDASRIYGVQGATESPLKRVTEVPTVAAAATPIAHSSEEWKRVAHDAQQAQLAQVPQSTQHDKSIHP